MKNMTTIMESWRRSVKEQDVKSAVNNVGKIVDAAASTDLTDFMEKAWQNNDQKSVIDLANKYEKYAELVRRYYNGDMEQFKKSNEKLYMRHREYGTNIWNNIVEDKFKKSLQSQKPVQASIENYNKIVNRGDQEQTSKALENVKQSFLKLLELEDQTIAAFNKAYDAMVQRNIVPVGRVAQDMFQLYSQAGHSLQVFNKFVYQNSVNKPGESDSRGNEKDDGRFISTTPEAKKFVEKLNNKQLENYFAAIMQKMNPKDRKAAIELYAKKIK